MMIQFYFSCLDCDDASVRAASYHLRVATISDSFPRRPHHHCWQFVGSSISLALIPSFLPSHTPSHTHLSAFIILPAHLATSDQLGIHLNNNDSQAAPRALITGHVSPRALTGGLAMLLDVVFSRNAKFHFLFFFCFGFTTFFSNFLLTYWP